MKEIFSRSSEHPATVANKGAPSILARRCAKSSIETALNSIVNYHLRNRKDNAQQKVRRAMHNPDEPEERT